MSQTCSQCGFVNRATNRFCSNCGVTLVPAPDATTSTSAEVVSKPAAEATTYKVQTWDAPEAIVAPPTSLPSEPSLQKPTFLPYGSQASAESVSVAPAPVTPDHGEVGTYAPYSPGAARKMEEQKPERSWLMPSLVGAALLVLLLVVAGGFLLLSPKNTSVANSNSSTPQGQKTPSGATTDADQIKDVINRSNDEQITAWRTLDTEVLKGTRTGQVLAENIQAVEELRRKGMYAVPANKSIEFGEIKVNGDTATAETTEVWTVTFYSKGDDKVVLATGPDTLHETYHLVKQDGKWLVSSLDIVQDPQTPPGTPTVGDV